jgi:hypothetical protein
MSTDNGGVDGGGGVCEIEVPKEEQATEVSKPEQNISNNTPSGGGGIGELLRICKTKLGGLKQETKIISASLDEQNNNNNNNNNIENSNSNNSKEQKLENELKKELKEPKESNEQNSNQPKSESNNSNHLNKSNNNYTNININQHASNKINIMPKPQRPILEQTLSNLVPILPKPATTPINKKSSLIYNSFPAPNSIINASLNTITTNNNYNNNNVNLNSICNNNNNNIVVIQKHKNKMTPVESRNQRFEDIKNTYEQLINEMKINSGITFFTSINSIFQISFTKMA